MTTPNPIQQVTVCGGGVLGAQIAFQTAFHGYPVVVYDIDDAALQRSRELVARLPAAYRRDLHADEAALQAALERLSYQSDLALAVQQADLVIEAIPENLQIKNDFYARLGQLAPAKTLFASNSSTLLPSDMMDATGRPEQFLALHFANQIWVRNVVEVMSSPRTSAASYEAAVAFGRSIGMIPIQLHKEQRGYVLNSLLVPLLNAALGLWATDVADPATIDRTWMRSTGAPLGPMGVLDQIGLRTPIQIMTPKAEAGDALSQQIITRLRAMVEEGRLGVESGRGFYEYPRPAYRDPDFFTP